MKCIFIVPYFGTLPNHFQLWLDSCEKNDRFDFWVITDDKTEYYYPQNVTVEYLSLSDLKNRIDTKLGFNTCIDSPYKLCDFKPTYGYVFSEHIKKYDFWGHCDIDLILGDLDKFLTNEILNSYKKIFFLGHMTLYKNEEKINRAFMLSANSRIDYKKIFTSKMNYAFDEINQYSINTIFEYNNYSIYKEELYADISCMHYNMFLTSYDASNKKYIVKKQKQIFAFEDGKIYSYYLNRDKVGKKEFMYIHFQKREMQIKEGVYGKGKYLILHDQFSKFQIPNKDLILSHYKKYYIYKPYFKNKYKALQFRVRRLRNRLNDVFLQLK